MNDKNLHINRLKEDSAGFLSKGRIEWNKTEAEVWAELESKISKKPLAESSKLIPLLIIWSAAAVITILIGLAGFVFFYSKTIECRPGQNLMAELPDGSTVEMNAGSELKYYPVKWRFQRRLKFEGEGFFNVKKGEKFEVVSNNGKTRVLGTTFNIYARDENYRVTCLTGLVEVVAGNNQKVVLEANSHAEIENGKLVMKTEYNTKKAIDWKLNFFDFSGRPLMEVFKEIERQYAVQIRLQPEISNRNFSSNFSKPEHVEDVLDYVCKSMQLKFVKQSENVFLVVKENE